MTYVVTSATKETLKSGRMVFPGQEIPDREAAPNTRLIVRGALIRRQEEADEEGEAPAPEPNATPPNPEGEKAAPPAPEPAAKSTPSRQSRRSKAPTSSGPNKEDDPK